MERNPVRYCSFFVDLQEEEKPAAANGVRWVLRGIRKIPTTKLLSLLNGKCLAEQVRDEQLNPVNPQRVEVSGFCHKCRHSVSILAEPTSPPQD